MRDWSCGQTMRAMSELLEASTGMQNAMGKLGAMSFEDFCNACQRMHDAALKYADAYRAMENQYTAK